MRTFFSGLTIVTVVSALAACGGDSNEASQNSVALSPAAMDVSNTSAISIENNTVVDGLTGQIIGSSCKVLPQYSPNRTTNFSIGFGPPEPTVIPAGENMAFFDSASEFMFSVEAIKPVTVTNVSPEGYKIDCGKS